MSIVVSCCDLNFGNQFTTITSVNSALLIMIWFAVISLNQIVPGYATVCIFFVYLCGHAGMQYILGNANQIHSFSEQLIRECKVRTNTLENTSYWRRKCKSIKPMSLSLRHGYCKLFAVKKSMRVPFLQFVAIYTINAVLGIPINSSLK